jgi:hypothetical protein
MDLSHFMRDVLGTDEDADLTKELRYRDEVLTRVSAKLKEAQKSVDNCRRTISVLEGLQQRGVDPSIFSVWLSRWFFVRAYSVADDPRRLASLECVIIPETVVGHLMSRPQPHADPAKAQSGVVTWSPVFVEADEIVREAVGKYASGVRVGTYADVLVESCTSCGKKAVVVCNHSWDFERDEQAIEAYRLCPHCPQCVKIASRVEAHGTPSTLLPPSLPLKPHV